MHVCKHCIPYYIEGRLYRVQYFFFLNQRKTLSLRPKYELYSESGSGVPAQADSSEVLPGMVEVLGP